MGKFCVARICAMPFTGHFIVGSDGRMHSLKSSWKMRRKFNIERGYLGAKALEQCVGVSVKFTL